MRVGLGLGLDLQKYPDLLALNEATVVSVYVGKVLVVHVPLIFRNDVDRLFVCVTVADDREFVLLMSPCPNTAVRHLGYSVISLTVQFDLARGTPTPT